MALTPAWFMNGLNREGTRPALPSTTRACGVFVLSWVVTESRTGRALAHGPRRAAALVLPPRWPRSRVGALRPGVGISVSTTSTPLRARIFVSADVSEVTVLNLEILSLAPAARHTLQDMATRHPEYFALMQAS